MSETLSVFQWSILALAALCIGMSKTGVQGMMLLIVPYMAMAFGAKESTGVILPMLCMADIMAVAYYKRIADWKTVAKFLPTALLGFLVALFVDKLVPATGIPPTDGLDARPGDGGDDLERNIRQGKQMDA